MHYYDNGWYLYSDVLLYEMHALALFEVILFNVKNTAYSTVCDFLQIQDPSTILLMS